ncbi:hypothetical protein DACRYDRAFT_97231 [Dacryopinax primogenitus]|uniref:Low temperature requirement A n=1 Tax=Dacryopinax primogenitus (strain DJM 731) TaxID=1858805 RepID=M5FNH4_DACPD|nr:uncharacterized protein DACRYDRAFT_97231 [Dacryopinax primogenitus]EJT97450.1 hypothetical protein DACRYDRAFT_97231 [Dacryopinax primogenitus]
MIQERSYHERNAEEEEGRGWNSRLLQFAIKLKERPPNEETHEQYWLDKEERAPDWLELFYDLVIVAVLSVFSTAHEVSSPHSVLVYFSYFVIIWWVWASQTMYDVHFQANDWLHRIFKCLQLASFIFVGAGSANFTPFSVLPSDGLDDASILMDSQATSWKGVAIAYAAGRFILVLQYMLVAVRVIFPKLGAEVYGERRHMSWVLAPACIYLVSGVFWLISALLTTNAGAKVALAYFTLAVEFLSAMVMPLGPGYMKPPAAMISERFGALTLIILGEGIIGIVRSFSFVISGFGFSSDQYLQCVCALIVLFASWHFLFHGFPAERPLKRKSGALWLILHLPLHFVMLLLLSGMRNATIYGNIGDSFANVVGNLQTVVSALATTGSLDSVPDANQYLAINLGKINVATPYAAEITLLNSSINDPTTFGDPQLETVVYFAQIMVAITDSFQIELSDEVKSLAVQVLNFNTTFDPNDEQRNETLAEYQEQFFDFGSAYVTDLAQGTLFFVPCAGGLVILASLLVLLRAAPLGKWMWIGWGIQVTFATALCFLGFLDVGNQDIDVNSDYELAAYQLLDASWMLPVVAIVFAILILIEYLALVLAKHTDMRRRASLGSPPSSEGFMHQHGKEVEPKPTPSAASLEQGIVGSQEMRDGQVQGQGVQVQSRSTSNMTD